MKHTLTLILLLLIRHILPAQEFTAKYNVTRTVLSNGNKSHEVAILKFNGYYYKKDKTVISFYKPLYLNEYPGGAVTEKENDFNYHSYNLEMDTLQAISYCNFDTMILRYRNAITGNFTNLFEAGIHEWKIFPEIQTIHGLTCQRATLQLPNGSPYCQMWFAVDIPLQIGFRNLLDMPGLMVEGENFGTREKYMLESYSFEAPINNEIFWPKEFEEPFKQQSKILSRKNKKPVAPPSNNQQRLEISNQ